MSAFNPWMFVRVGAVGAITIAIAAGLLARHAPISHRTVAQLNVPSLSSVLAGGQR